MTSIRHSSHELTSQSLQKLSKHFHEALSVSVCQIQIYQALCSSLDCFASWRRYRH